MIDQNEKRLSPALIAIVLLLIPAVYVGSYFALGTSVPIYQNAEGGFTASQVSGSRFVHQTRAYNTTFEAAIFRPLGMIEAGTRGIEVQITTMPQIP